MRFILILSLLLSLTSCAARCRDYAVVGCDEFVIDSYKIRQGKISILEMEGLCVDDLPYDAMEEYKDVIAEDDILNIVVYHPKRKDMMEAISFVNNAFGGFKVNQGKVDIPDVPPVPVVGLTLEEARCEIREEFDKQVSDTEVFVSYKDRLSRRVELTGMVQIPTMPVDGKIRLYEVLSAARVPSTANFYKSYVVRDGEPLGIDMYRLMVEGDMEQNIVMRGGDKVYIAQPQEALAMVMGEVGLPTPIPLTKGYTSLREALVAARGIPFTGDKRNIQVIRGSIPCPKIYVLAWEHIIHLPNDSLLLMPGDTVYVSEKPITKWNRFIEQLLPSASGVQTGYGAYQKVYYGP